MEIIDNVNVKIDVNQPSLKTSVDIPDVNIKTKIQAPLTEKEYERDYNKLLNIPTINGVEVKGNKVIEDFEVHTSELTNDGDGQSPFATEDYVEQNGGKIDKILLNDNEQAITNKTVNLRVTKATVGLSNANNTSDMDKPVSNAQANAINQVQSNLDDHLIDYNNPHKVNKTQIGLSNVDNTSDLDKPISTQTQAALDELEDTIVKNINPDLEALSADIEEVSTKLQQEMNTRVQEHTEIQNDITTINSKIPNQASSTNQLADKAFVNSTINSNVAFFKGNFATYADLMAVQWQTVNNTLTTYVTNNDYAYVESDETHNNEAWRYIYVKDNSVSEWQAQFKVNDSPFTQAQLDAINSGATADLINSINSKLTQEAIVDETGDSSLKAISQRAATLGLNTIQSNLNTHISNTNNPHNVTKAQLGLGNVNNTSDLDKPISNAVRTALANYVDLTTNNQRISGIKYFDAQTNFSNVVQLNSESNVGGETSRIIFYNPNVNLADPNPSATQVLGQISSAFNGGGYASKLLTYRNTSGTVIWSLDLRNNSGTDGVYDYNNDKYKSPIIAYLSKAGTPTIQLNGATTNTSSNFVVKKGSDWSQFQAYSASNYYRAFEADDSRIRLDIRDTNSTASRRFVDIDSRSANVDNSTAMRIVTQGEGAATDYVATHNWVNNNTMKLNSSNSKLYLGNVIKQNFIKSTGAIRYYKLLTWNTSQSGRKLIGHLSGSDGYNAADSQNFMIDFIINTSNGSASGTYGYFEMFTYQFFDKGHYNDEDVVFYIAQPSSTKMELYCKLPAYCTGIFDIEYLNNDTITLHTDEGSSLSALTSAQTWTYTPQKICIQGRDVSFNSINLLV